MGNTAGGGGLPFDVGEEILSYSRSSQGHWKMHKGVKRANGETVSIFRLAKKGTSPLAVEAGQRGFQKLRGLRHPYILACLNGAELDTDVVMATEEVVPLGDWLATRIEAGKKDDQIAWGMHCMCAALKFLHESCKQSHNNVCADTIFVTRGGDWKLGGMDLLSALDGSDNFLQIHQSIQPRDFQCPERLQGSMHTLANLPLHIQDIWSLGRVLQVAYPEGIPPSISKYVEKMMDARADRRPTPSQYLRCAFLKRPAVQHLQQLEDWSVASAEEKGTFLRGGTAIAACPRDALRHKLSALLLRDIEMAMAAAAAAAPGGGGGAGGTRAVVATALPPLLDIEREAADAALSARVQPLLVALFTMNDRGVRAMLLSKVDAIAPRLDAATVNARLFDPLCAGFTDAAAQLRELTLKSMVVFTDKLSDKNMNDKLIRHLARLQGDPEDSIRTNTIIFLGKIAGKLKPAVRDKVLLPAFARGIRDPFPAARLAGLRATAACAAYCEPMDVCTRVLPVVMPCLVDQASHAVREAAFACVELYLAKLRDVSELLKIKEEELRLKANAEHVGSVTALSPIGPNPTHVNSSESGAAASGPSNTWGSWAINILSEKLANSTTVAPGASAATAAAAAVPPPAAAAAAAPALSIKPVARTALPSGLASDDGDDDWADAHENAGDGWDDGLDALSDGDNDPHHGSPPRPISSRTSLGVGGGARTARAPPAHQTSSYSSGTVFGSAAAAAVPTPAGIGAASRGPVSSMHLGTQSRGSGSSMQLGGAVSARGSMSGSQHRDAGSLRVGEGEVHRGSSSSLESTAAAAGAGAAAAAAAKPASAKKRLGVMKLSESAAKTNIADGWDDF